MSSTQLEKFRNSIKPDLLDKFDKNLMVSSGFIPVDIRNNDFFIIVKKSMTSNKPEIEVVAKDVCRNDACVVKFISLADDEFEELFASLSATVASQETVVPRSEVPVAPTYFSSLEIRIPATPDMTDEQFFMLNGWVRENHLPPAKEMAKAKKMPLYAAFLEWGFVTDEHVRAYLTSKYGVEIVKAEDVTVDLALFKGLNDDFIFKKFAIFADFCSKI